MNINDELLKKLQNLASIEIQPDSLETTKANLNEIVHFVENINKLDLEDIPASFNPINSKLPMREDIPQSKSEIASNTLKYAPNSEENFFIVPKIIE
ncbi:Asp-tRNA(Asn)/Glu-tRNA(Gln) amidotransferase subunit GatC [Helicobacter pullorum NCTC 12824]|uniref:Asp-tRNA(Asn)/Glu-tRNA(Gln) amidotransferase subunit GatC n=1 Tax=Helicobacter pullorum TaxID=35818 RepID=UPI00124628B7|nr:Asp-tRNA(Asn)/Glu-tRNA(Gln) amidotransferase subunit GatC [Helicobacter pullorum]KAB0575877.1 Asp-tRNA(Asn)/Glu-tRNA(Gln) amidotransferase subunit GatC [Helicobacter pullorum NCTC 12824]